jgi:hypothetical protein
MHDECIQYAPRSLWPLLAAALFSAGAAAAPASAAAPSSAPSRSQPSSNAAGTAGGHWSFRVDDDGLAFGHRDRDYTGGLAFTLSGAAARRAWNPAGALRWVNEKLGLAPPHRGDTARMPGLEIGVQLFTPQDLRARAALTDDRPYASLVYLATSELSHTPGARTAYQSTLSFGFLGLPFAGQIQRAVHDLVDYTAPEGYAHQISAGGEPTLRYTAARYALLSAGGLGKHRYALRFDTQASAGYITEAAAGLAVIWGNADTPWWAPVPQLGDYAGQPELTARGRPAQARGKRFEIAAGVQLRARFYDALLQGQFRHSDVAYSYAQLEHALREAWIGAEIVFSDKLTVTYVLRRQSRELKTGRGAQGFTWAGITITRPL